MSSKVAALKLVPPDVTATWLEEPAIEFARGRTHVDPKTGVALYGPRSFGTPRHKNEVHVGFIGTGEGVERAKSFYDECRTGIPGDLDHAPFPGCTVGVGYRCELRMNSQLDELITRQETQDLLGIRRSRQRFEVTLELLETKVKLLTQRDHPLDYVVLILPEELHRKCRAVDYVERSSGPVHRDLRRAFKAMAMRYLKPTQLLLETTTAVSPQGRELDHKSVIAWNLFTGLYFKADGLPWGPTGLPASSCFVGVSFFRPLGEVSTLRTSVVQAFDENGEGLVLRGHDFQWDERREGRSPHLSEELSGKLIEMVLQRYRLERGQSPQRLVVHKTSEFEPAERAGFETALRSAGVGLYDLLAVRPVSDARLIRTGQYPVLRGSVFTIGDTYHLYTTGYLRELGRYPHGHVPSPLRVSDHVGDTATVRLLGEIMTLTKMNWNSANFAGLLPVTLRFSQLVGEILREVPAHETPEPKFKYYI